MKQTLLVLVLTAVCIVTFGVFPSFSQSFDEHGAITFYESCINREITKCKSKAALLDSQSANLQEYARMESQKAEFLANEKDSLIDEMLENEISQRDYAVEVYLNQEFYQSIPIPASD